MSTLGNRPLRLQVESAEAMETLGARVSTALKAGDATLLRGPLGSGKTTLARGLLRCLTGRSDLAVPSPSYTLVQTYETALVPAHHIDLYRIDSPDECVELGLDEMAGQDLIIVEWPERLPDSSPVPAACLDLTIGILSDETREVTVEASDDDLWNRIETALANWP